ncbi:MAG: SDR family oxidoreductase [Pseudomonadota bacterium]
MRERVLVLGGYGLIGLSVSKRLIADGHDVTGMARSMDKATKLLPEASWLVCDISKMQSAEQWEPIVSLFDVIVNAAGALQNSFKDDVEAVQRDAIIALIKACETKGVSKFVQISAPGAIPDADTLFYRSKGEADEALKKSSLDWTIFRPGLVVAPQAYGGTSLVRMLAAFPIIQPIIMKEAPVQTVSVYDVAEAVSRSLKSPMKSGDFDLVESADRNLGHVVLSVRQWLGFGHPKLVLSFPNWFGALAGRVADIAGWLGWRTALRTSALKVLTSGVKGDSGPYEEATGHKLQSLDTTLLSLPSTAQERVYARAMLLFPIALVGLSLFWIVSGLIGFAQHDRAVAVIAGALPEALSNWFVRLGSVADCLIGIGLLIRPWTTMAAIGSVLLSAGYLFASAVFTPVLWSDPLGPMVKVFPAILLALMIAAIAEDR